MSPKLTGAEFRTLYERLRRQVPWGPDDRRGALNYITQEQVRTALGEARLGRTMSLAAPVEDWTAADNPDPARLRALAEDLRQGWRQHRDAPPPAGD